MEDSNESPSLMIVLNGTLELSQKNCDSGLPVRIQKANIGAVLCQLQALTNEPSFFTVTALTKEVRVARLESAIGKKRALKIYDRFTLNNGCFWESRYRHSR